ncbi:potassium transporter Kup [Flaviflexus huanghaiensis]|uniref:potassium transporter Kup n=1 Tax=Flaviflexus huanghaiensis TaxID=1111473 RepID=UPI0015FDDAA9|nr:KUP/HAK/KT family potassium transporter [Flaviflexus huanghaiensis]
MTTPVRVDAPLALGALGVVFGDIGTSPLYAMHAVLSHDVIPRSADAITGIISLVFWSLITIVAIKYISLLLSVDNDGDGGIIALSALVIKDGAQRFAPFAVGAAILGAGLFYGDGIITPAISVMSATEGLAGIDPSFDRLVVPLSALVVVGLFSVQRLGTGSVGALFGPAMLAWFLTLAALGVPHIAANPSIITALLPHTGLLFIVHYPVAAFFALGAIVLVVTGAEALYADMGHFGPRPIRLAWFAVVLPCLTINYLGQGALLLGNPDQVENPFFEVGPDWARLPLVILASCAAIIASQAVISGIFSMTRQAEHLGYLPHIHAIHTSRWVRGQIYLPTVNRLLLIGVLTLILVFQSSSALANAYGLAVTSTLVLTSLLFIAYVRTVRRWPMWQVAAFVATAFSVELVFFGSGLIKIVAGGWIPLLIAAVLGTVMVVWRKGRRLLNAQYATLVEDRDRFLRTPGFTVVPGTAVYPHVDHGTTSKALLAAAKSYRAIHERIVIVSVETLHQPHVPVKEQLTARTTFRSTYPVRYDDLSVRYGFKDEVDIPAALAEAAVQHLLPPAENPWYVTSEAVFTPAGAGLMPGWQRALFVALYRASARPASRFRLPKHRTLVIGISADL